MDTGLACHLAGWRSPETASLGAMAGPMLENLVVVEIWKSWHYRGIAAPLWFYRDKERREVDVILADDGVLYPVEVKLTASPDRSDLAGIAALEKTGAPVGRGAVVCLVNNAVPLSTTVDALPVAQL